MAEATQLKNLTVEDARARMLNGVTRLGVETVPLEPAPAASWLRPVVASRDQPPFDASAMDGWAIRRADYARQGLCDRRRERGGQGLRHGPSSRPGGAHLHRRPVPAGADLVVIQEEATRDGDTVRFDRRRRPPPQHPPGRRRLPAGDGCWIPARDRPLAAGLAAAAGRPSLDVARRPRVAILATGDELVRPAETRVPTRSSSPARSAWRPWSRPGAARRRA
jgi:molybdopterin molybdotransferase